MKAKTQTYVGFEEDGHGLTQLGRIVLDARIFGLIDEREACAGWELARMQTLMQQVDALWDRYGHLPSRLPDDLRARHAQIYEQAMARARQRGWNPELDEEE